MEWVLYYTEDFTGLAEVLVVVHKNLPSFDDDDKLVFIRHDILYT